MATTTTMYTTTKSEIEAKLDALEVKLKETEAFWTRRERIVFEKLISNNLMCLDL